MLARWQVKPNLQINAFQFTRYFSRKILFAISFGLSNQMLIGIKVIHYRICNYCLRSSSKINISL